MNILILPLYGIGDVLMTTPALRLIKEGLPDSHVTCLSMFRTTHDVLKGNPHIDSLIHFPFLEKRPWESLRFLFSLRGRFDCSINFYPSNRRQYNLLSFLAGSAVRLGHRYEHRDILEFNFLKNRAIMEDARLHNVKENVRLLNFLGLRPDSIPPMEVFLTPDEERTGREMLSNAGRKMIGIHAGTSTFKGHRAKRWPAERFSGLISSLDSCDFFLFGGPDDRDVNEQIRELLPRKENVFLVQGRTIREVAAIIKQMDLFVSNDSGLMHLAAATGVPVVAIFGPTNADSVRPWGLRHEVVRLRQDCSPCFYFSPKPLVCTNHEQFACIREITVEMVREKALEALTEGRDG